jgi:hypothetical protein
MAAPADELTARLQRIENVVQSLEEELASIREEGRVVSEKLAEDSAAGAKRSTVARDSAQDAKSRLDRITAASTRRTRRKAG